MSLLSTFGILFETDAERARREIDGVDESLGNAESTANNTAGSFDDLNETVDESSNSFFGLSEGLTAAAAGLIVVTGLFAGITSQSLATDEIGKFSETLGLSIEEVGAWGEAVKRSGGDSASFRGSLAGLNGQLTDISLTGGGEASEVFARLGINAVGAGGKIKSAFSILPELADSFQRLSRAESVGFGQKLGLDQGTILLLQQGRVAVEQLVGRQKELGVATKEDYLAASQFNSALDDSIQVFANIFTSAGTTVLPLLTSMLNGFELITSWIKQNKTLVTGFFIAVSAVILNTYLPAMVSAAAATLAAAAPFLIIGAAIAALGVAFAILYEDVVAYLGGQESYIGDLAKKYEWFGTLVNGVIDGVKFAFKTLSEFAGEMFDNLSNAIHILSAVFSNVFGGISESMGGFGVDMGSVVDGIIGLFSMLGNAISGTLGFIASPIETTKKMLNDFMDFIPDIGGEINEAFSGIKSFFGFSDDGIIGNIDRMIEINGKIDNNKLNGQTSASIINSQQSVYRVNNFNVGATTVNTRATDANGVANAVSGSLNNQIQSAVGNLQDAEAY